MRTLPPVVVLILLTSAIAAQKPAAPALPGEAHAALARLAGTWDAQARFWLSADPSEAPTACKVKVDASLIMGGRFLFQKVDGECAGQVVEAIGVIGHDNVTGRYQAASFGTMGTDISLHVGEKNDAGDIVLHLSYQDRATGVTVQRRTVRSMLSENEWVETAHETRNGATRLVMEIRARRASGAKR